jgi:hypothetical protein
VKMPMDNAQWTMPNPTGSFDHTWFLLGRGRYWALGIEH